MKLSERVRIDTKKKKTPVRTPVFSCSFQWLQGLNIFTKNSAKIIENGLFLHNCIFLNVHIYVLLQIVLSSIAQDKQACKTNSDFC